MNKLFRVVETTSSEEHVQEVLDVLSLDKDNFAVTETRNGLTLYTTDQQFVEANGLKLTMLRQNLG